MRVLRESGWGEILVEIISLPDACCIDIFTTLLGEFRRILFYSKTQTNRLSRTIREYKHIVCSGFGAQMIRVDRLLLALYDIVVKTVFHISGAFLVTIETTTVGFIFGKEQGWSAFTE